MPGMNRVRRMACGVLFAAVGLAVLGPSGASGRTTAFTYQGRLDDAGTPTTGPYDFEFRLFDAPVGGLQVGATQTANDLAVMDGLFTRLLNFGAQYNGAPRWLEIAVRPGASIGAYTTLAPRQALTGTPYAQGVVLPLSEAGATAGIGGTPLFQLTDTGSGRVARFEAPSALANQTAVSVSSSDDAFAAQTTGTGGLAGLFAASNSAHAGQVLQAQSAGASDALFALTQVSGTGRAALFKNFNSTSLTPTVEIENQSGLANTIGLYSHIEGFPSVGGFAASVKGAINSGNFGIGVWGHHAGGGWGLFGDTNTGVGVVASSGPTGHAAWFQGRVLMDGNLLFEDEGDRITFPATSTATPPPMIEMFASGTANADRMVIAHSPGTFSNWGLQYQDSPDKFNFVANGAPVLTVNLGGGTVGVDTATPAFDLHVNGTAGKPGGGSWAVASDARLKTNVRDLQGALERLLALRGVTFEFKDPAAINELPGTQTGMIAQEVEKVFPEWIAERPDGYKSLSPCGFEALTVEALRELRTEKDAQIEVLRAENTDLRARLEALEALIAERLADR